MSPIPKKHKKPQLKSKSKAHTKNRLVPPRASPPQHQNNIYRDPYPIIVEYPEKGHDILMNSNNNRSTNNNRTIHKDVFFHPNTSIEIENEQLNKIIIKDVFLNNILDKSQSFWYEHIDRFDLTISQTHLNTNDHPLKINKEFSKHNVLKWNIHPVLYSQTRVFFDSYIPDLTCLYQKGSLFKVTDQTYDKDMFLIQLKYPYQKKMSVHVSDPIDILSTKYIPMEKVFNYGSTEYLFLRVNERKFISIAEIIGHFTHTYRTHFDIFAQGFSKHYVNDIITDAYLNDKKIIGNSVFSTLITLYCAFVELGFIHGNCIIENVYQKKSYDNRKQCKQYKTEIESLTKAFSNILNSNQFGNKKVNLNSNDLYITRLTDFGLSSTKKNSSSGWLIKKPEIGLIYTDYDEKMINDWKVNMEFLLKGTHYGYFYDIYNFLFSVVQSLIGEMEFDFNYHRAIEDLNLYVFDPVRTNIQTQLSEHKICNAILEIISNLEVNLELIWKYTKEMYSIVTIGKNKKDSVLLEELLLGSLKTEQIFRRKDKLLLQKDGHPGFILKNVKWSFNPKSKNKNKNIVPFVAFNCIPDSLFDIPI